LRSAYGTLGRGYWRLQGRGRRVVRDDEWRPWCVPLLLRLPLRAVHLLRGATTLWGARRCGGSGKGAWPRACGSGGTASWEAPAPAWRTAAARRIRPPESPPPPPPLGFGSESRGESTGLRGGAVIESTSRGQDGHFTCLVPHVSAP
jgi:hypothetical protein